SAGRRSSTDRSSIRDDRTRSESGTTRRTRRVSFGDSSCPVRRGGPHPAGPTGPEAPARGAGPTAPRGRTGREQITPPSRDPLNTSDQVPYLTEGYHPDPVLASSPARIVAGTYRAPFQVSSDDRPEGLGLTPGRTPAAGQHQAGHPQAGQHHR